MDASGNVGVGTSSPGSLLTVDGGTFATGRFSNLGAVVIRRAEGTQASPTAIASGSHLGLLDFRGYDGSTYQTPVRLGGFSDSAISNTSSPGYFLVSTTPSGSTTPQERLRITSAGLVGVGTSSPTAQLTLGNLVDSTPSNVSQLHLYNNLAGSVAGFGVSASQLNYRAPGAHVFFDGTTERARIDSSGNLGIGSSSPQAVLHVERNQAAESGIFINNPNAGGYVAVRFGNSDRHTNGDHLVYGGTVLGLRSKTGTGITFESAGTERARIDSSGRLLVGTSSQLTSVGSIRQEIAGGSLATSTFLNNAFAYSFAFTKSRGTSIGTIVQSGDELGNFDWYGDDGTGTAKQAARIQAFVDGTPGANDMPGRLVFSTTADGASSPTERMTIYSNGNPTITNSSFFRPGNDNAVALGQSGLRWTAVWAANGTIQTSDGREKTAISDASLGSDFIKALRPVSYKWIEGGKRDTGERDEDNNYIYESVPGERTHWGFIAQEVKQAVDDAGVDFGGWVLTDKDDPDSQQALRYDQFIAPLTKALQEAIAKIETLEAKVAALESA